MSNGSAFKPVVFSPTAMKVNSAFGSIQRLISQAQAMRSTPTFSQVIHFIVLLLSGTGAFPWPVCRVWNENNLHRRSVDIHARVPGCPVSSCSFFSAIPHRRDPFDQQTDP